MPEEPSIKPPSHEVHSARYDHDCQDALTARLDDLLNQAEQVGWNKNRAAAALMYLAAKRLNPGSR